MTTINGMRKKWELDYKKENWKAIVKEKINVP